MSGLRLSYGLIAVAACGKPASLPFKLSVGGLGVKGNLDNLEKEGR